MCEYGEYAPREPHGSNAENRGYSPNAEKTLSLSADTSAKGRCTRMRRPEPALRAPRRTYRGLTMLG